MPTKSIVALYCEPRASSPSQSAEALLPAFEALHGTGFGVFFRKGRSRKAATTQPFVATRESLHELLAHGINRRDVGKQPISELGQSLALWSGGAEEEAYDLTVQIGSTAPKPGHRVRGNRYSLGGSGAGPRHSKSGQASRCSLTLPSSGRLRAGCASPKPSAHDVRPRGTSTSACGGLGHHFGHHAIHRCPSLLRGRSERRPKALLERLQQRRTNNCVVLGKNSVA